MGGESKIHRTASPIENFQFDHLLDSAKDSNLNYMSTGGFSPSALVPRVGAPTLILWGEADEILEPKLYAQRCAQSFVVIYDVLEKKRDMLWRRKKKRSLNSFDIF